MQLDSTEAFSLARCTNLLQRIDETITEHPGSVSGKSAPDACPCESRP
jgi:hypothetical protein